MNRDRCQSQKAKPIPETFYAVDREKAKRHANHPLTLAYIERLEEIARLAEVLYDALSRSTEIELSDIEGLGTAIRTQSGTRSLMSELGILLTLLREGQGKPECGPR